MSKAVVDPRRIEEEWEADQEVLANLVENGDRPELERPVDVSFRGSEEALERLIEAAEDLGFDFLEMEENEDGEPCLFLVREQRADPESIKALTVTCLQIEADYGVEYDGWGCAVEDGTTE
ncbi:MAG: ribonuclease E inhibitor RraB [Pseudomonadota bacterium]